MWFLVNVSSKQDFRSAISHRNLESAPVKVSERRSRIILVSDLQHLVQVTIGKTIPNLVNLPLARIVHVDKISSQSQFLVHIVDLRRYALGPSLYTKVV